MLSPPSFRRRANRVKKKGWGGLRSRDIKKRTAKFLGVLIGTNLDQESIGTKNIRGFKRRSSYVNVTMDAPIKTLMQRLESKGFMKFYDGNYRPQPLPSLSPLPTIDLILRYRSILNGFLQYYSFADNIREMKYIYNLLRGSLEKTICYKENLSRSSFLKSYGRNVKIDITKSNGTHVSLDFTCPRLNFTPLKFLCKEIKDPLREVR